MAAIAVNLNSKQPGTPVFGIHPLPKRILGLPDGAHTRVRMRHDDIAKVFIRFQGSTARFTLQWANHGLWQIAAFTGVNSTIESA